MDEQTIILRCQQGDTHLLDNLVRLHADSLYRFCCHISGNSDSAAELFQDTWVRALINIKKCKADGSILGWLFTIAANIYRDKYRRQKRWHNILLGGQQQPLPPDAMDNGLISKEQQLLVRQALDQMDDEKRVPLILFYFEEYSLEAIATLLDVPVGTVKSRLHRAKKHLKTRLEVLL